MYGQLEDVLTSITMPLRSAIGRWRALGWTQRRAQPPAAVIAGADRLKALAACDEGSLKSAVREMCAQFGQVTRIDILTMAEAGQRRALCFLRLESDAHEARLMASLGVGRFGDDVLIVVELARAP